MGCEHGCLLITESDPSLPLKYVLGILNSKLYYYWLFHRGKRKGEALELYQRPLSEIPLKRATRAIELEVVRIVDCILDAQRSAASSDTSALEHEIDQQVYALYGLTPEEIAIVEGTAK
jgi:adenine-specific DNA-methyltransferase